MAPIAATANGNGIEHGAEHLQHLLLGRDGEVLGTMARAQQAFDAVLHVGERGGGIVGDLDLDHRLSG
ncbi:hypothetical protein ACU4GH_31545 [Bradyrhizobium betae]